jgi:lipopolysaccharide export system protein LptC
VELRTLFTLVALLCATVASGVLLVRSTDEEEPAPETPQLGIGYYAKTAELRGMGDDGHTLYRLSADSVVQAPSDGSVNLTVVAVDYAPTGDVPWSLTAETGRIPPGDKMIELSGNVFATTRDPGNPAATIRTDYLLFDPVTSIASTDRKVVIEYAGSTLHAIGLRALLRENRLELLSAVSGRYVR